MTCSDEDLHVGRAARRVMTARCGFFSGAQPTGFAIGLSASRATRRCKLRRGNGPSRKGTRDRVLTSSLRPLNIKLSSGALHLTTSFFRHCRPTRCATPLPVPSPACARVAQPVARARNSRRNLPASRHERSRFPPPGARSRRCLLHDLGRVVGLRADLIRAQFPPMQIELEYPS
jgi:hypothetical protein